MSLSDRRSFLHGLGLAGLGSLTLAACGFSPAFTPTAPAGRLQDSILADAPADRDQFLLIQQFEDRLGRGTDGRYTLGYSYAIRGANMAVTADNVTTRFNLIGRVDYVLRDRATDAEVLRGSVDGFTGYSLTGSTTATEAAASDARRRLAVMLADRMVTQLIATAANLPA